MITLKDEQIETIDFNCEPTGTFDNALGQRLLADQLRAELPTLPSPGSTNPVDLTKLAKFTKKVDYLRKYAFIGLRDDASDILNWQPTLQPVSATPIPPIAAVPAVPASPASPASPAISPEQKNPKSKIANPKFPPQPPHNPPLPPKPQPESDADQKRITSESTRIDPESTPNQTRTTSGSMHSNGDPRSAIDQRPLSEQETIYAAIKTYGPRQAIKVLARPLAEGGLAADFSYGVLYRFSLRYMLRQAKEKRALAREACLEELSNLGPSATSAEIAQAFVELRVTDSVFDPKLNNAALTKAVRDLSRLHAAKHADRRLKLAEERVHLNEVRLDQKRSDKMWDDLAKLQAKIG